jgi:hypothetical protein
MDARLANVITDVTGQTGLAILRAIVAGERDPAAPAKHRNYRIRAGEEAIAKSLRGTWKEEHPFCLGQSLALFDTCRTMVAEADARLKALVAPLRLHAAAPLQGKPRGRGKNAPDFDVREALQQWAGVDLARIGGIDVGTALKVLVEPGPDLSRFKTAKHFASWLGLCPGTRISGGRRLSGAGKRIPNRVARALRRAAQGLSRSQCGLGAHCRRMAARMGAGKAITATAHKLARPVYALLTQGTEHVEQSQAQYEEGFADRTFKYLRQKAKALGYVLVAEAAA